MQMSGIYFSVCPFMYIVEFRMMNYHFRHRNFHNVTCIKSASVHTTFQNPQNKAFKLCDSISVALSQINYAQLLCFDLHKTIVLPKLMIRMNVVSIVMNVIACDAELEQRGSYDMECDSSHCVCNHCNS